MKSIMTAFMTAHGATLQQEGFAGLGLDSCGRVLCGGDLQFGLDKTGLFHCEWQCPDDQTPAKIESIQLSGEGRGNGRLDPPLSVLGCNDGFPGRRLWMLEHFADFGMVSSCFFKFFHAFPPKDIGSTGRYLNLYQFCEILRSNSMPQA